MLDDLRSIRVGGKVAGLGLRGTDLLTIGLDGTSVYEAGFGAEQISIATPSIGWSRSNIGLGNRLCGEKGAEAYCYYANISVSLRESLADVETQTSFRP